MPDGEGIALGLDTFGDVSRGPEGVLVSDAQALRDVVEEGVLAEQVGVDHFVLGEHHREDMPASAPDVVLSAIASRTERIKVGSAVTLFDELESWTRAMKGVREQETVNA